MAGQRGQARAVEQRIRRRAPARHVEGRRDVHRPVQARGRRAQWRPWTSSDVLLVGAMSTRRPGQRRFEVYQDEGGHYSVEAQANIPAAEGTCRREKRKTESNNVKSKTLETQ